jgi:hypothetical protein
VFNVQAYQTSQYVVPRGGIFLGKWRSSFAGSSDGKMNVQSACALNTRYFNVTRLHQSSSTLPHIIGFSRNCPIIFKEVKSSIQINSGIKNYK